MRASEPGCLASAGRYSFRTIDAGTFQVGLMVMESICCARSGLGMLGLPMTTRVVHTCRPSWITLSVKSGSLTSTRELRDVAMVPAPSLHVGDDGVDAAVVRRIELLDRQRVEIAGRRQFVLALKLFHGFGKFLVIAQIGRLTGNTEPLAQLRHAGIFHRALAVKGEHRTRRDFVASAAGRLAAQLRQRGLEFLIGLVRRAELIERLAGVGRLGDGRQHLCRIGRTLRQRDVVLPDQAMGTRPACTCRA